MDDRSGNEQFKQRLRERDDANFIRLLKLAQYLEISAAIGYAASIADQSSWDRPSKWLVVTLLVLACRSVALWLTRPCEQVFLQGDVTRAAILNGLCGVCWGASAFYLIDPGDQVLLFIASVWLMGMLIASFGLLAVTSNYPVLWGLPILVCLVAKLFLTGGQTFILIAFGVILLSCFIGAIVSLTRTTIRRDFSRELQNSSLVIQLEKEKARGDELNSVLRQEIQRREGVEAELILERDHAEHLSTIDGLTGIGNRRAFDDAFAEEIARARRNQHQVALILIDVDHFKEYNDHCGHQAGDEVLTQAGKIIEAATRRGTDFEFRYGGEEFAVVLPVTDLNDAGKIAEYIRVQFEVASISHPSSPVSEVVTVSLGVASLVPDSRHAARKLFKLADEGLYAAKASGRNQVHLIG